MAEATRKRRLVLTGALALAVLTLDLWSKAWAWSALRDHRRITIIDDWAYLEFGFNTGAAFSLLADASYARIVFLLFSLGAVVYLARLATQLPTERAAPFVAIALVLAGVFGNAHDRLFRSLDLGGGDAQYGVVDFVRVYYWPDKPWPIFNIADVALVAGVILLVLVMPRRDDAPPPASS